MPRAAGGPSDEEIRARFEAPNLCHYNYQFEGGLQFKARHSQARPFDCPQHELKRFRHFMPWLVQAAGGTLKDKRVLDIGCNSGFWSIQCALFGAREVVGFDARRELIDQAEFVRAITGVDNVQFRVLDFWDMNPQTLGGTFDVVLNLGILYHLSDPLEALKRTRRVAQGLILLDTMLERSREAVIGLRWEEPSDISDTATAGVVAWPSKAGVELMLRHVGLSAYSEIPVRTQDIPTSYYFGRRAAWLIRVGRSGPAIQVADSG